MAGTGKSAMDEEVIGSESTDKEISPEMFKDISNKLDHGGDGEKGEMDKGKSAVEEAYMPSDKNNPSDRGEEAVTEGSGTSAIDEEAISQETLGQLLKDMSNKLDHGDDDEKGEMNRGKSAIEEAYKSSNNKSPSDRGEAALTEGSGKSAIGEEVISLETDTEIYMRMLDMDEDDWNRTMVHPSSTSSTTIQDDDDSEMDFEADSFASYRRSWESNWSKTCGSFEDITVLSSMQFTHHIPGLIPMGSGGDIPETLQIFSIKLTEIVGGLQLPLSVYGVVAVRDIVDRNRNILFYCSRSEAQELKQNDPFLHLFGPSRAIVSMDTVYIEIELKVKGALESEDKPLMTCACEHIGLSTMCFKNDLFTLELCSQKVRRTVQATILSVQVVKGKGPRSLNFKYGGLVACTPLAGKFVFSDGGVTRMTNPSSDKIVLLESKEGPMPQGLGGYLHLWRQVVSVEFEGGLDVVVQAYSESGGIAAERCVHFMPKQSNISQEKVALGDAQVIITVAWSLVATDKDEVVLALGRRVL
ncbi:unnamed protein product [Alopecurus aequalis]